MKVYKIRVDGVEYEVEVEEVLERSPVEEKPPVKIKKEEPKAPVIKEEKKEAKFQASPNQEIIKSPMPGSIWKINTSLSKEVEKGELLLTLEAMKMENEILAPRAGKVVSIDVREGDSVKAGDQLLVLE